MQILKTPFTWPIIHPGCKFAPALQICTRVQIVHMNTALDSCILNRCFIRTPFGFISVFGLTALLKMLKIQYLSLSFFAISFRVTEKNFIIRNRSFCPILFLSNVSLILKILTFIYSFCSTFKYEPRHEKTYFLYMRKQTCSAFVFRSFVFAT